MLMLMLMRCKRRSEFTEHAPGSKTKFGLDVVVVTNIPDRKRRKVNQKSYCDKHTHTHTHTLARATYKYISKKPFHQPAGAIALCQLHFLAMCMVGPQNT